MSGGCGRCRSTTTGTAVVTPANTLRNKAAHIALDAEDKLVVAFKVEVRQQAPDLVAADLRRAQQPARGWVLPGQSPVHPFLVGQQCSKKKGLLGFLNTNNNQQMPTRTQLPPHTSVRVGGPRQLRSYCKGSLRPAWKLSSSMHPSWWNG